MWRLILSSVAALAADPTAEDLLKAAEFIRNPQTDYRVIVGLKDEKGGKKDIRTYQSEIKGRDKALIRFLSPKVDEGTKVLMVEQEMWIYLPSTAKPVRISPSQKLSGNAAYGDVARLNFTGNYRAKLKGKQDYHGKPAYVLDLQAIEGRPVTYDRIEYWIDVASKRPLKALYSTSAGKILREGYFERFAPVLGVERPTLFRLVDHIEPDHVTTLVFKNTQKASLPEIAFERQNLSRD